MRSPWRAPMPELRGVSPVLADLATAAVRAVNDAWSGYDLSELTQETKVGADGTPSFLIDDFVEAAILDAARPHAVNILSEEIGFVDGGHVRTVVLDPIDGSANAVSGVPLTCFSAALVEEDTVIEALNIWLEQGHVLWAKAGEPVAYRTSGRTELDGAVVHMLRPKENSHQQWSRVARRAGRVRILSTSCLEAMLVAQGAADAFADTGSDTHRIVDLAAALLFIPAAGGAVLDAYGRPFNFSPDLSQRWSGVVAATPALAEELADEISRG